MSATYMRDSLWAALPTWACEIEKPPALMTELGYRRCIIARLLNAALQGEGSRGTPYPVSRPYSASFVGCVQEQVDKGCPEEQALRSVFRAGV